MFTKNDKVMFKGTISDLNHVYISNGIAEKILLNPTGKVLYSITIMDMDYTYVKFDILPFKVMIPTDHLMIFDDVLVKTEKKPRKKRLVKS